MNKIININKRKRILFLILFVSLMLSSNVEAQNPELATAIVKVGKIWGGIVGNGDQATFDFRAGFFPNDFGILQYRGQQSDNYFGSGFRMGATGWLAPNDSLYTVGLFGPKNDFMPAGKVVVPLTSFIRYKYPEQIVNGNPVAIPMFTNYDPTKFTSGTYDQVVEVTSKNIIGVEVKRRVLAWSQTFNDNYVLVEVELTNVGVDKTNGSVYQDTLRNFHFGMSQGMANNYYSYGNNPAPPSNERPNYQYVWQNYYGARPGDSLRLFYFYSADDPGTSGDNMGAPALSQNGRLLNTNYTFYSILHASATPFTNIAQDVDDFLQPRVTYIGTETKIPSPEGGEDPYGSKNYWAMRGGYSDKFPRTNIHPGTHHGVVNDELGVPDFSSFPAGVVQAVNSKNFSSFGPYNFQPNAKLRFVYAVGTAGIGEQTAKVVGEKWLAGTLTDPPNMPDPNTGWLPSNFAFPNDATEMDKKKARWISMGRDSVMLTAWRAKWNFENNYEIPQSPPPPSHFSVTGYGDGVELKWKNAEAEVLPNFAGYIIMRRISNMDTVFYNEVYSSDATDKADEHVYKDQTVVPGAQYYYYIQSKALIDANDSNADPTTRGKIIYSGRAYIPNVTFINPPRFSTDDMARIRIVPNPYNINDPLLKAYGYVDQRGINFFNLPQTVTIKIYTEHGDLVQTIEHNSPERAGSYTWDMISSSQQVINSGLYIAVFQKPNGEVAYHKFLVVR
jgi:hypothetical protein